MASRVEEVVIAAVDQGDGVVGQGFRLVLDLEGRAVEHRVGARVEVTAQGAAFVVRRAGRVAERSGGVYDDPRCMLAPADVARVARGLEDRHRDAGDREQSLLAVDDPDALLGVRPE